MTRLLRRSDVYRLLIASVAALTISFSAAAQTRIEPHRNSFSPEEDVRLGRQAATEVRRQLPMLNDGPTR